MNSDTSAISVLISGVSLLGLIYLYFWRFTSLWIDEFRQSIFSVRDELFDYAAQGNIAFDHPAYTTLRSMLNGYIRFSHRISALYFVLILLSTIFRNRAFMPMLMSDKWIEVAADLDAQTRRDLNALREKTGSHVFHFLFLSSFTKKALVLLSLVGPTLFVKLYLEHKGQKEKLEVKAYRFSRHSNRFKLSIDTLETEAYVCGKEHALAA